MSCAASGSFPSPRGGSWLEAGTRPQARLRQARADSGLTQEEVAKKLGRTQTWVSNSELGERRVDFVELEDFAELYGKALGWFGTSSR